jgi:DNA-binding NarL/FixJ family response regulator
MIQILVADDHAIVRRGFVQIINETNDLRVAAEAANADQVLKQLETVPCDVCVLDISMPGKTGLEILPEIRKLRPNMPVLVLSMHSEEQYAVRALKGGASGYLTKESAPDQLIQAIRQVASGKRYVTPEVAVRLASSIDPSGPKLPHERLSDREYQVLCMIASGKSVGDIAKELFLSVKTVSTHRARILKKMNLKNNAELTKYAFSSKLVE